MPGEPTFDDRAFESRLVWIFGSPRTGSTWLSQLLIFPLELTTERPSGSIMPRSILPRKAPIEPIAVPVNEPFLPSHLTPILDRFAEPGAPSFLLKAGRGDDPNYFFADAFAGCWRPEVRRLILVRLHAQAELAAREHSLHDPFVVVKEPNGSHGADVVMSLLLRSRIIFQLRDGRDVIDSMLHARSDGGWLSGPDRPGRIQSESERLGFVRRHSRLWMNRTLAVQRAYDAHPPELRIAVRYEDLRSDTVGTLRPLFDWLGVDRSDQELEAAAAALAFEAYPTRAKGPAKPLRAATPGLWRENMSDEARRVMNEIMGETLERLGYEV
ncbi:MAG: sulfotransferase [Actinomycetota bacterium]